MVIALPETLHDNLPDLGPDEVAWYRDAAEAAQAAAPAEVLWLAFWRTEEIQRALAAGPNLRWVTTAGAGVDSYPLAEFRERRIVLTNGSGVVAVPIAEYVVMAMLAAAKGFPELARAQDHREWLPRPPAYGELARTRALVLGYGSIGRAVAERLRGLEVEVIGVRTRPAEDSLGPDEWRSRLAEFDWVILTLPLTSRTRCVIGKAELGSMKPSAWILNVSRGGLIDPVALEEALRARAIGGAYLDVTDPEPLPPENPLWTLPNVIITPHSSWATDKMTERAVALFLDNLNRYRSGQPLLNVVDLDAGY